MLRTRLARSTDDQALEALVEEGWLPHVTPGDAYVERQFFDRHDPTDVLVAADGDDAPIGYATVRPPTPLRSNRHVLSIEGFGVTKAVRGQGIGRLLLKALDDLGRERGCSRLTLRVLSVNTPARGLYESYGYRVEGVLVGEFMLPVGADGDVVPVDDILMARFLDN
jgi:ribosomal protein S18 acetylase RimI-like enzyme